MPGKYQGRHGQWCVLPLPALSTEMCRTTCKSSRSDSRVEPVGVFLSFFLIPFFSFVLRPSDDHSGLDCKGS